MVGVKSKSIVKTFSFLLSILIVIFSLLCTAKASGAESGPMIITADELSTYFSNPKNTVANIISNDMPGEYIRLSTADNPNDPSIVFSPPNQSADEIDYIIIQVRTNRPDSRFKLYLNAGQSQGFSEDSISYVYYSSDHEWQMLMFDLRDTAGWNGDIHSIRLDYIDHAEEKSGDYTDIAGIAFCRNDEDINLAVNTLAKSLCKPANAFDNFTEESLNAFDHAVKYTSVSVDNSNLVLSLQGTYQSEDPYIGLNYSKLAEIHRCSALNAEDVSAIVIRINANDMIQKNIFELFYYAGGISGAHPDYSVSCQYPTGGQWDSIMFDFDTIDWSGHINGLRFDWNCGSSEGAQLVISDILFFDDIDSADLYTEFIDKQNLITKDYNGKTDQTEDEIPDYPNEETDTSNHEDQTEEHTEIYSDTETESKSNGSANETANENETSNENEQNSKGSEVPFYIMCAFLICISIGSVLTVAVIRIRTKKQNK